MTVLQDEARRTGTETHGTTATASVAVAASDYDILETFPFDADMGPACHHVVHKTMASFLNSRGILPQGEASDTKPFPVIVSLSGGVDSMVIASALAHLATSGNYNIKVYGIHIDYANRPESAAEANYVQRYCHDKGIQFCLRRIDEVTRGVDARDEYENESQEKHDTIVIAKPYDFAEMRMETTVLLLLVVLVKLVSCWVIIVEIYERTCYPMPTKGVDLWIYLE
jgi:PP-loop family